MKGDPIPDEHHVLRHCSGTAIERTDTGEPVGVTKEAFYDDDPDGISVTWIEFFGLQSGDPERAAIAAICATRRVRRTHRFGKFNVGLIKRAGKDAGVDLKAEHDPIPGNPAHSVITGLVSENHANLMNTLALDLVALLSPEP